MAAIIVSMNVGGEEVDVGDLLVSSRGYGNLDVRFRYDPDFGGRNLPFDPNLQIDGGVHQLRGLPLAVEDASPDTWGELLVQRAERQEAEVERRDPRKLTAEKVLLAASDLTRQGALRFRTEHAGHFLNDNVHVPKFVSLEDLFAYAEEVSADPNTDNWIAISRLLATGTSGLGGARPKAAVQGDDGGLWIAKFPKMDDRNNVPVWEKLALDIAERAGLKAPARKLVNVGEKQVLLVKRFDRDGTNRIPYISARTLLNARDLGTVGDYLNRGIAPRMRLVGANPDRDVELLWKQAALNLVVNNTDNHLRNHGFLWENNGWALSPVFDLDPNPDVGSEFATLFDDAAYRSTGFQNLGRMAAKMKIAQERAREMLEELLEAIGDWEGQARALGIGDSEVASFAAVFDGALDAATVEWTKG